MCTLAIAFRDHPRFSLIVAANRDEFYHRPTDRARFWAHAPQILGGRDLQAGGSWMALHRNGRFAALTNYRDPRNLRPDAPSRGPLVSGFLESSLSPEVYLLEVANRGAAYNGFNLLVFDGEQLGYCSNFTGESPRLLPPGVYGLSNALLDSPWPKLTALRGAFAEAIDCPSPDPTALAALLEDPRTYPDDQLPQTGVPLERERQLSALRIHIPDAGPEGYGTCCSTVLLSGADSLEFLEVNRHPHRPDRDPVQVSFPRG